MPPSLPPEILDLIVDHLHDELTALKACCVVSESWIHRTRTHLFARIEFRSRNSDIKLWKKAFPDPSNSPAHHTRHLLIRGILAATGEDMCGWIRAFHNLVHLQLEGTGWTYGAYPVTLVPFHGLSPTLRSLSLTCTSPEVLDLICSFPLLEDLALISPGHGSGAWKIPPTSSKLTGSLNLSARGGIRPVARRLLSLPNGLHFTKISVHLDKDIHSVTDLVSRCSDTLESISVCHYAPDTSEMSSLDLSKATKLKDVKFRCDRPTIQWITTALRSIESKNLQQVIIHCHFILENPVGEAVYREWKDLDHVLVQFWASHSIHPKIKYEVWEGGFNWRALAPSLMPELTQRRAVDLLEL